MSPKRGKVQAYLFFISIILFLLVFSNIKVASSSDGQTAEINASENDLNINVLVFLSGHYGLWEMNVRHDIRVNLTLYLREAPQTDYTITCAVLFSLNDVTGLPSGANYTYGFWGYPPIGTLNVYFPKNVSKASIFLEGHFTSSSVLWRNSAEVFFFDIASSLNLTRSYRVVLIPPSHARVLRAYSSFYPELACQKDVIGGADVFVFSGAHPNSPIVVLYEPDVWEPYAIALMFLIIFSVFAVPYVLKSKSGKIAAVTSRFAIILRKADVKNLGNFLKRLYFGFRNLDSSKLLHAYVLCALLMVSLSFAVGPDPRVKVYVLSSTQGNAAFIADFLNENGAFSITIFDEMSEFELLSDLGVFSAVVVGDFYPPTEGLVKNYIYPAFDVVPQIIVVKDYAFESFVNEVVRRYGEKTVVVNGLADLSRILVTLDKRANPLCLEIPLWVYMGVSGFVGLCSLLIVFLGFTFLASKLLEIGKKPGVGGFAEAIAYAFFLFFFTQMIYIVCSVLLAMPLGLHTSSPKVTAIGFMGFGGGSRPRMFAGLAGVLFGAFASLKEGLKLSREGLAVFVILFLFILIDPLTHGVVFYEFVLLYTAGPMYETAFAAWTSVRTFLSFIGFSFGGLVSPIYGLSTGIILYYAGAIPIVLFSKLEKGTATVFLFICAFWAASGGIRVADMMPWKSVASSIPGIVVGLFFSAIFWLISLAEKLIKAKLGRVY